MTPTRYFTIVETKQRPLRFSFLFLFSDYCWEIVNILMYSIKYSKIMTWTMEQIFRVKTYYNKIWIDLMLYCHQQHHNDTTIKTQEDFFNKIFTYHFIARVRKRLLKVCVWEGAGDRTELKYFDPHSYGRQRCVFLVLLMLNRRPWGPLCWVLAFFTASYQQPLWTLTHQGPKSLRPGVAFATTTRL